MLYNVTNNSTAMAYGSFSFSMISWSVKWSRRVSNTFKIEWYNYCKESRLKELLALEGSCCFSTQRNESNSVLPNLLKKKLAWLVKLDEQVIKIRSIPFNNSKFLFKQLNHRYNNQILNLWSQTGKLMNLQMIGLGLLPAALALAWTRWPMST